MFTQDQRRRSSDIFQSGDTASGLQTSRTESLWLASRAVEVFLAQSHAWHWGRSGDVSQNEYNYLIRHTCLKKQLKIQILKSFLRRFSVFIVSIFLLFVTTTYCTNLLTKDLLFIRFPAWGLRGKSLGLRGFVQGSNPHLAKGWNELTLLVE